MEKRFNLKVTEVLDKQFNIDLKGYSAAEVDEFLDLIIADYQSYDALVSELGETLRKYEDMIESLNAKIESLESMKKPSEEKVLSASNVDILKRLSRLEAEVFKR